MNVLTRLFVSLAGDACAPQLPALAAVPVDDIGVAFAAIPGAEVLPPAILLPRYETGVIVASLDEAFFDAVRQAIRTVRDGYDIHFFGGRAEPDLRYHPNASGLYVWGECWCNGYLLGPEPRRARNMRWLLNDHERYWIVRPARAAALPGDVPAIVRNGDRPAALVACQKYPA